MTQILGGLDADIVWQGQLARVHDIQGGGWPTTELQTQSFLQQALKYKQCFQFCFFITFSLQEGFSERNLLNALIIFTHTFTAKKERLHPKRRGGKEGSTFAKQVYPAGPWNLISLHFKLTFFLHHFPSDSGFRLQISCVPVTTKGIFGTSLKVLKLR